MQRRTLIQTALLMGALTMTMMAADVAGKWSAQVPGRDGEKREQILTFVADGAKLSGTMSGGQGGDVKLEDVKVDGSTLTFKVTREMNGNTIVMTYTGKMAADQIQFMREGGRAPQEFTAKRVK